jgi:hypothetical protein
MIQTIQKILFLRRIYSTKTADALATDYIALFAVLLVATIIDLAEDYEWMLVLAWLAWAVLLARSLAAFLIARSRIHAVRQRSFSNTDMMSAVHKTALAEKLQQPRRTQILANGPNWQILEVVVDVERQTKYGNYVSRQLYYSVFEGRLSRVVPNVLFDSKHAKGRQFKYMYLQSQRLSLEGGLDDIFTVYAPDYYEIDTLSFISPEVLLHIQAAKNFDIEIVGDRVFLYGPLLLNANDVAQLQTLGEQLTAAINDNIDTYADSYLTGDGRRTTTTAFARQLLQSPLRPLAFAVAAFLIVVGAVVMAVYKNEDYYVFNELTYITFIVFATYAWKAIDILLDNRRMRKNFAFDRKARAWAAKYRPFIIQPDKRPPLQPPTT